MIFFLFWDWLGGGEGEGEVGAIDGEAERLLALQWASVSWGFADEIGADFSLYFSPFFFSFLCRLFLLLLLIPSPFLKRRFVVVACLPPPCRYPAETNLFSCCCC